MKINLPTSILITGFIIAGGILLNNYTPESPTEDIPVNEIVEFNPITDEDNIYGNPTARVKIIEYSDFECPFCQEFHSVMGKVMDTYAKTGQVSWIYRHIPSEREGSNSLQASLAAECAKNLAPEFGLVPETVFFDFAKEIFAGSPESLNINNLKIIAEEMEISPNDLEVCIASERYLNKISRDVNDVKTIAEKTQDPNFGTPYILIVSDTGLQAQLVGSQTYSEMIEVIDLMLNR